MKMKKLIFLLIISTAGYSVSAQTINDDKAKSLYFKAIDEYTVGDYRGTLKKIEEVEKLLGGTNPRLSYLTAKSQYKLSNLAEAQTACKKYFASVPKKDPGYEEIQKLSEEINIQLRAEFQKQAAEAAAKRTAEEERLQKEREETLALAKQMEEAALRRAQDIEIQKIKEETEAAMFRKVQQENTKEAYQNFIYDYPSGKYVNQAKAEMQKKWPSPTRMLKNNKYGYIDSKGKMVVKASYDQALEFSEGLARVGKNNKYGFINEKGKVIIPVNYLSASNFNYGLAVVKPATNKAFFIDKNGKPLDENIYRDAKSFSEGLAAVQDESYKYGFINTQGEVIIPFDYTTVSWFKEGIAAVGKNEGGKTLYAYIDQEGNLLTDFEFEEAKDFQNGVGRVRKDGKFGLIDKFGSPITYCQFDYISEFSGEGLALAKKDGYDVLLDMNGQPWIKVNNKLVKITL
jgi:hypothetical protein